LGVKLCCMICVRKRSSIGPFRIAFVKASNLFSIQINKAYVCYGHFVIVLQKKFTNWNLLDKSEEVKMGLINCLMRNAVTYWLWYFQKLFSRIIVSLDLNLLSYERNRALFEYMTGELFHKYLRNISLNSFLLNEPH
jgi:hypothetical protein